MPVFSLLEYRKSAKVFSTPRHPRPPLRRLHLLRSPRSPSPELLDPRGPLQTLPLPCLPQHTWEGGGLLM